MFKEHTRELNYMAKEAGVKFTIQWTSESLIISVYGYNESFERYYEEIFKELNSINVDKDFFESKKEQLLQTSENLIKAEPNQRFKNVITDILIDGNLTIKTQ